ncbi:hypothetical protein GCM10027200_49500 [Lentzea nigeriaca]
MLLQLRQVVEKFQLAGEISPGQQLVSTSPSYPSATVLEQAGFRVVFQELDMLPGQNTVRQMQTGTSATRTIAVLSPPSRTARSRCRSGQPRSCRTPPGPRES